MSAERIVAARDMERGAFRWFDFVMAAFVTILLLSNVIGAGKVAVITLPLVGQWPFGAGILFFPLSYVIGDVLTEVYGYARARRVIWAGTAAVLFMAFMSYVVVALPPAPSWTNQAAYEVIFGQVPRIVLASVCAFWAGEFANAYVMARMKVWTGGRHLWSRTIGSTLVPVYANVEAAPVADPGVIRALLVAQVTGMVRWRESVLAMEGAGVTQFVEFGGKVLGPMVKRIAPDMDAVSVVTMDDIEGLLARL